MRDRRAVAVIVADGETIGAPRGVLADVGAPALYRDLVGEEHLPAQLVADLQRFQYDPATFKVDWALSGPIPWRNEAAAGAGTVHVCDGMDGFTQVAADLAQDRIPARPFVLVGQMNKADPTRSPVGTETVWAYTHVPLKVRGDAGGDLTGKWDAAEVEAFADRVEAEIEETRAGLPRAGHRSPRAQPTGARGGQRQPRRRRARRRHDRALATGGVPAGPGSRSGRDPRARPVPARRRQRTPDVVASTARAAPTRPAPRSPPTGSGRSPAALLAEAPQGSDSFQS